MRQRYRLSGPYILLPNQFWDHKNHRAVVDALRLLNERGQPVHVLCTGSTAGLTGTSYYDSLMQYAAESNVLGQFTVLGIIPFADLSGLMVGAVALLNPSYFEGWSTSVEEAKSLGKTILLSDIPVHREQNPPHGIFFPPDDPEALAGALVSVVQSYDQTEDLHRRQQAADRFAARRSAFGRDYLNIVSTL